MLVGSRQALSVDGRLHSQHAAIFTAPNQLDGKQGVSNQEKHGRAQCQAMP